MSGIVVEIARHARFARVGHEQASLRSNDDDVSPRPDLAPGQAWLQRVGGDGEPAVAVSFDYLSSWGPDDRPTWVAEIELHPVDCRERVLRAGAYSLQLAATGGTTRTVVLSRPQSGACWRGEVMKRRTSLQRPSRDPAIDRLFQTQG